MGQIRRGADGRGLFTTEFKRAQIARVLGGEITQAELVRELDVGRCTRRVGGVAWFYNSSRACSESVTAGIGAAFGNLMKKISVLLAPIIAVPALAIVLLESSPAEACALSDTSGSCPATCMCDDDADQYCSNPSYSPPCEFRWLAE